MAYMHHGSWVHVSGVVRMYFVAMNWDGCAVYRAPLSTSVGLISSDISWWIGSHVVSNARGIMYGIGHSTALAIDIAVTWSRRSARATKACLKDLILFVV